MPIEEYRSIWIFLLWETMSRLNNNYYGRQTLDRNIFWNILSQVVQDILGYLRIHHDGQNTCLYNPGFPPPGYNPPAITGQQLQPIINDPRGVWQHTSQIPTLQPRETHTLKRRRSRWDPDLDDVFLPNHDEDRYHNNARQERNRYDYRRRYLYYIKNDDNRNAELFEGHEGAERQSSKRQKMEPKEGASEAPVHDATEDKQATVDNKKNFESSRPSEKVDKSGADEQPTKKCDKIATTLNDAPSDVVSKNTVITELYFVDLSNDTSSDVTEDQSAVDMEISFEGSSPKRREIDQSCIDDREMETEELENVHKKANVSKIDKLKEPQNNSEKGNDGEIENTVSIKGYKEPQNMLEGNNDVRNIAEVNKTVSSDSQLKNIAKTGIICDKTYDMKLSMQKTESEAKTGGDNKVDTLYKRSQLKESVFYRMPPGYTIPKKIKSPQSSRKDAFSDINDVYSIDLHPDSLNTSGIHLYSSNPSKPENNIIGFGTIPKINNLRRSLDQSRSFADSSSIDTNVLPNNPRSKNCVPEKLSFRRHSDHRRPLDAPKWKNNKSPPSSSRSPLHASNSESTNCNRSAGKSKSSSSGRENSGHRSNEHESIDTSQNVSRPENVQTSIAGSKAPTSNRGLFKISNRHGSHKTLESDKRKAQPADDRCNKKKKAGECDSPPQDSSAKSRENKSNKHSAADESDENTDNSRVSGYRKWKRISSTRRTSNKWESMKPKQISNEEKVPEVRRDDARRHSSDSKVDTSKIKRNMVNSNRTSKHAPKIKRGDKRSSETGVSSEPTDKASSNMYRRNKTNKSKKAIDDKEGEDKSVDAKLTSKKEMINTAAGPIVILEKTSTRSSSSLDDTHSGRTSNSLQDNSMGNYVTSDYTYSNQSSSNREKPHTESKSDTISEVTHTSRTVDIHGHSEVGDLSNEVTHNDSISDAESQCDVQKSGHTDGNEVSGNDPLDPLDLLDKAVESSINSKSGPKELLAALRKMSASNNNYDKLILTVNKLASYMLDQGSGEKVPVTGPDESSIAHIKEASENIDRLVDGNNTVLFEAEQKSKDDPPVAIKVPLDLKSHTISFIRRNTYTEDDQGTIKQLFDGKNSVLVSASKVNIQVVQSTSCEVNVLTVTTYKPLRIRMHEVTSTSFEADSCSPLSDFSFKLGNAKSSLIEPPDYGTVTIVEPIQMKEQDITVIDLVDDKPDVSIIDLTEEDDVKKEVQIDHAADIYDILNEATVSNEQITLYRSDETVNDSLDVQTTSVSISPSKAGSCEVKQESNVDDEVKIEKHEELDPPDSIFTEIELLNINRKAVKPEAVEHIICIKDEADISTAEKVSKEGTDSCTLGSAEKTYTETEKEKEPGNAGDQCEDLSVQNVSAVLPSDDVIPRNTLTCSGDGSAVEPVPATPNISEPNSRNDRSNQACITVSDVEEHHRDERIQERVVREKAVQAQLVDAFHKINQINQREEGSQAINNNTSQHSASITESGGHLAKQSLSIPPPTKRDSLDKEIQKILRPPVVSQATIPPQKSFEASTSYRTDTSIQRNNALPHARKDGSIEARAASVIQTQDSLQQQDIWILTGVLVRYLIRVHYLNTSCYNYNRTLAPYESIDPKMHHDESSGISEFHDTRLSLFAAAMKATFQPHTFNPPPIPEDVLKVTHNRMRKILPPPQSEMKWIIVALFHLMRKEAEYYYTHVSLKYLYIYLTSASQQLNGPNRNLLTRQQSQQLLQKRHQFLAPDQLYALKNQIQQFNNICSRQHVLLDTKSQMAEKSTQMKRAYSSTTNGKSQLQPSPAPPSYTKSISSRQDLNNFTNVASAISPKIRAQLLQATPPAPSSTHSSSRFVPDIMSSPNRTMSAPITSSANVSTPVIRFKQPSSLMQDMLETSQTNSNLDILGRTPDKFPCANTSNLTRQNMSAGNPNSPGCAPRAVQMTPTFGTTSTPMHQPSNLTGIISGGYAQEDVYPPLPNPTYRPPVHNVISTQRVPTSSGIQYGVVPETQHLSNPTYPPRHQNSDPYVTNESRSPHLNLESPYSAHGSSESSRRNVYTPAPVPNQNLHSVRVSPAHNYWIASPARRLSDQTWTGRSASVGLPNMSSAQREVPNQNLPSAHRMSNEAYSATLRNVPVHETPEPSRDEAAYCGNLLQNLLNGISQSDTTQNDAETVSPGRRTEMTETLDQTRSIAAELSQRLTALTQKKPESKNSSNQSPRISPAQQFGTQTSSLSASSPSSEFLGPAIRFAESMRTSAMSSANDTQHAQLRTSYAGSISHSIASTPKISPDAPTGSLTSVDPITPSTPAYGTPRVSDTPEQITIIIDDDESPDTTPVQSIRRSDQLGISTGSPSPVSHISEAVEVIDLTWIDDLDEAQLEMEVHEMVKKEEAEDVEEMIINNIIMINNSQKYRPE